MNLRLPTVFALLLGLCLACSSLVSAAMMAPDRASHAREVYEITHGALIGDLCSETHHGHEHHCPFCHALPDLPRAAFVLLERAFLPQEDWLAAEALRRAAQGRNVCHSTRAPPQLA